MPGCLLLSTVVSAKTLFAILFSIDAVADVAPHFSVFKGNIRKLLLLQTQTMEKSYSMELKNILMFLMFLNSLPILAPGDSHLLSCFFNSGSPSDHSLPQSLPSSLRSSCFLVPEPQSAHLPLETETFS